MQGQKDRKNRNKIFAGTNFLAVLIGLTRHDSAESKILKFSHRRARNPLKTLFLFLNFYEREFSVL